MSVPLLLSHLEQVGNLTLQPRTGGINQWILTVPLTTGWVIPWNPTAPPRLMRLSLEYYLYHASYSNLWVHPINRNFSNVLPKKGWVIPWNPTYNRRGCPIKYHLYHASHPNLRLSLVGFYIGIPLRVCEQSQCP